MIAIDVGTCFKCTLLDFNSDDCLKRIDVLHDIDKNIQIGQDYITIPFGYPIARTINICEKVLLIKIDTHVFHQYKMLYNTDMSVGITEYTFEQISNNF